jgi:pimeloyl-ACP methyl ester carboxylesterase
MCSNYASPKRDQPAAHLPSPFKSRKGEAEYLAAYGASMQLWPVPYESLDISNHFGRTHVVASGPKDAPPLVLLHGLLVSLTIWAPNIADLSWKYRVYVVDVMGQPGKSIPGQPITSRADYVEWITTVLDALKIDQACVAGMSYGGWLTLNTAIGIPERIKKIVLLSPVGLVPLRKQFLLRSMLMVFLPKHSGVNSLMRWMAYEENLQDRRMHNLYDCVVNQMYLGLKHFPVRNRIAVPPTALSDEELRSMRIPTLLLIGQQEVLYDPAAALNRAKRLIPNLETELVPQASHEMAFGKHELVDARILRFLKESPPKESPITRRSIAI